MTTTKRDEGYKRVRVRYHGYGCIAFASCNCPESKAILARRAARTEVRPEPVPVHVGVSRWHRDTDTWPGKP